MLNWWIYAVLMWLYIEHRVFIGMMSRLPWHPKMRPNATTADFPRFVANATHHTPKRKFAPSQRVYDGM